MTTAGEAVLIYGMIILGTGIMISNIWRFLRFIQNSKDIMSNGKKDEALEMTLLVLLTFFLFGYVGIGLMGHADFLMAAILFGGSLFVNLVLSLIFHLMNTVKQNSLDMTETLVGVIELRDPNLNGHSQHVRNLTMLMYEHLPEKKKRKINPVSLEYAALLHDVGKIGVPEAILNKPGKLDDQEWVVMRQHPRYGVQILAHLKNLDSICGWIQYHHERIDGNGYYKIPAKDIPYVSKMIAIADTYSAITMKRVYKNSRSYEEAIEVIKDCKGTQFDPELADLFCSIPKEEVLACIPVMLDI